jgi:malonate transporter and related proteins
LHGLATHLASLPKSLTFVKLALREAASYGYALRFVRLASLFMLSLVSSLFTPLLTAILPVFALIFAGYACRKTNRLRPNASPELNRFVINLALPALLFDIMAAMPWRTLDQLAFIAVFGIGVGAIILLTLFVRSKQSRDLADVSLDGLNATYPNTGFVGLLYAVVIVLIELGLQTQKKSGATISLRSRRIWPR